MTYSQQLGKNDPASKRKLDPCWILRFRVKWVLSVLTNQIVQWSWLSSIEQSSAPLSDLIGQYRQHPLEPES